MILNYHSLSRRRDTWLKKDVGDVGIGSPPNAPRTVTKSSWLMYFVLLLALVMGQDILAQANTYVYSTSTGAALETIPSPTVLTTVASGSADDGSNQISPAGFSFTYNGTAYTQFGMSTNGWIQFGTGIPTTGRPTAINAFGVNAVVAFERDANLNAANGGNMTHGAAAGGKYVFQFTKNSGGGSGGTSATVYATFQIVLWGSTSATPGRIDIIYGTSAGTPASAGVIGIVDTANTYVNGVNGLTNNTATASAYPASGRIYTFLPPPLCTGTPNGGTASPALTNLCIGNTPPAITVTGLTTGVTGLSLQWEQSTDGGANYINAVGGSGATTASYTPPAFAGDIKYRLKSTCSGSGLFAYSSVADVMAPAVPATQASAVVFSATLTNATISWTNGNGGRRYVVVNTVNSFTDPVGTGDVTVAGTVYGSGEQIVYDGTGTSVTITGLVSGTTYYAKVYEYLRCTGTPNTNYYKVTGATNNPNSFVYTNNDNCANAITLPSCAGGTQTVSGSTTGATVDPYIDCGATGDLTLQAGVWYKYVGNNNNVTITTCHASGTGYDTRLTVYSGSCGSFTCVAGNDDMVPACPSASFRSEVNFNALAGTDYYVFVHGFQTSPSTSATGNFILTLNCTALCTPIAGNDECSTATGLTLGTPLATNNTCASGGVGTTFPSCGPNQFATYYDTWYSFNSGANTTLEISAIAVSPAVVGYTVYSGVCGTLTAVSCSANGAAANVTLTASTPYYIRVWSSNAAERGSFTVTVKVPCLVPTAVNVTGISTNGATLNWTASASAPANGYEYEVRSSGAAGSGATGLAASGSVGAGVVTAPVGGLATVTTYTVYVRSSCGVGDFSPWTSGVNFTTLASCVPPTALTISNLTAATADLSWTAPTTPTPGVGYEWAVTTSATPPASGAQIAGTSTSVSGLTGGTTYYLHVRSECVAGSDYSVWATKVFRFLVGDNCALAIDLATLTSPYNGDTTGATDDFTNTCAGGNTSPDLVYYIDVPAGFTLVIGQTVNNYDSENTLFYGGACPGTTQIACYDDPDVQNTTWVNSTGVTQRAYWVQDGFSDSSNFGTFTLAWTLTPPPITITEFSPTQACSSALEDTDVVITGSNFTGATDVTLNGVSQLYDVNSDTSITVHLTAAAQSGVFTVYNAVTSSTSGSSFTVNPNPTVAPITAPGGATNICLPDTLTLSDTTPTGVWSSSDVDVATVNTSGTVTPVGVGSVTISYTVTDGLTGCFTAVTYALTVSEPVEITSSTPTQSVQTGNDTSFTVTATGTGNPALTYMWEVCTDGSGVNFSPVVDDANFSGSNAATLFVNDAPLEFNGYFFQCTVTGICNAVISDLAVLIVGDTGFPDQPDDATICDSGAGTASFSVVASPDVTTYQWQEDQGGDNWQNISNGGMYSGTDTATLSLSGLTLANSGWRYRVQVTGIGSAESNPATLTVIQSVAVNTSPTAQNVCYTGGSAVFTVAATGGIASYQWQYSSDNGANWNSVAAGSPTGASYSGAATASLTVNTTAATPVGGTYLYRALVNANAPCAAVPSGSAQLIINNPTINTQPAAASVFAGNSTTFTVAATTLVAATYQWQYATAVGGPYANVVDATPTGVTYTGATSATLTVNTTGSAAASNARYYRVIVSSGAGCSVTSNGAQLTIINYCIPTAATSTSSFFNLFTTTGGVTNINNSTAFSTGGYGNYVNLSASQYQGDVVNFNTGLTGTTVGVSVFVDWNSDGDFVDAGEVAATTTGFVSTFSGSFTVPAGATPGAKRMRIYMDFNRGNPSTFPCGPFGSGRGEMEDYTFNVLLKPACSGNPSAPVVASSVDSVCVSGSAVLTASGNYATGVTGVSLQWYNTVSGLISGATGTTYTTPVLTTANSYYVRAICANGGGFTDSNIVTIAVANPSVTGTTPGVRCGTGTVALSGTASAGTVLKWYAAASGGAPLATGNNFTTPSISATTTYYAAAETTGGAGYGQVGTATTLTGAIDQPTAFCNRWSQYRGQYVFTAAELTAAGLTAGKITSVSFNITTLGDSANNSNFTVKMGTSASATLTTTFVTGLATVFGPATYTHAVGVNKINFTTPFTWDGTSNVIVEVSHSGANATNNAQTYFTATAGNTVVWSTAAAPTTGTTSVNRLNIIFDGTLCASARTAVAATVNTPPALTVSAASATICSGNSTPLTITSPVANYDTYTWSPSTGVSGSAATGYTFNPTTTTTYTLNALQTGGSQCAASTTFTVNVNPLPSTVVITPASAAICAGSSQTLTATGGTIGGTGNAVLGTATTLTSATEQPTAFCNRWAQYWNQTIYTQAELLAAGLTAGSSISSITYTTTTQGDAANNTNFSIRIGNTASNTLAAFQTTGLSVVYGPATYTHVVGANTIAFTTPYVWDGVSNIVLDVRHDGVDNLNNAITYFTAAADNKNISAITSTTSATTPIQTLVANATVTPTASNRRLNIVFAYSSVQQPTWTWSPATGLNTTTGNTVIATPPSTTTYTATATINGCPKTQTVTVTVSPIVTYYQDADSDGYGNSAISVTNCTGQPLGYVALGGDCNDAVAAIHPNAVEVPYNGVDDDCDGSIDETGTVTTTLLASSCGVTLASIQSLVGIQTVGGHPITGYRIRITNGAEVQTIEKTVPHFTFPQFPSYAYATTYTVDIQLQRAGIWQASWGAPCLVSTPAILEEGGAASVSPSQCGITLPKINTLIATSSIAGVTGYRFRVTNLTDPLGPNAVQQIDRTQNWFSLQMLTRYNYGTTYRIEVAVKTTGTYGGFGAPCEVSSPPAPSLVNCGGTVASGTATVAATSVTGATQYRFQIVRDSDGAATTIDRSTNWFIFNSVPASAFSPGVLYNVRVAVMTSGTWSPFGDICQITSPGTAAKGAPSGAQVATTEFRATASPNPFTADFGIDVVTSNKENVQLQVYDMLGKLIESREVKLSDLNMEKVGAQYPSGVYNVIVSQDGVVKTLRVIKR